MTGVVKGVDEGVFISNPSLAGKFPYIGTTAILPPVDDWLVLAGPAIITAAGYALKKAHPKMKAVEDFGIGGLLYQGGNIMRIITIRAMNYKAYHGKSSHGLSLKKVFNIT